MGPPITVRKGVNSDSQFASSFAHGGSNNTRSFCTALALGDRSFFRDSSFVLVFDETFVVACDLVNILVPLRSTVWNCQRQRKERGPKGLVGVLYKKSS